MPVAVLSSVAEPLAARKFDCDWLQINFCLPERRAHASAKCRRPQVGHARRSRLVLDSTLDLISSYCTEPLGSTATFPGTVCLY